MSEVTNMSQSLQNCQNKLDLTMEEDKGKKKEKLVEEPKTSPLKKRHFKTTEYVSDKKLKLSPSPLMNLPNEIWMKILTFLPTYDILKNFNLTCKHFHSLATNPSAIKSLQLKLENAKDSSQYHNIVKVLKRSKTLNKLIISGHGRMNHILAHGLKSNHLKTLEVLNYKCFGATLSKKNAEYIKNSKIESLTLKAITLDNYEMLQIGALKTLKSVRISLYGCRRNSSSIVSELIKTFIDAKIELENLAIVAPPDFEIHTSDFSKFLEERAETLKKLKIRCTMNDSTKKDNRQNFPMIWNVTSTLEELYYDDYGSQEGRHPIELKFGQEMPKLTKVVLKNINGDMFNVFGNQNFPVLERLYLQRDVGNGPFACLGILFNILENCPNLKSVKLVGLDVSDPQSIDIWCAFLSDMYKFFNVYIDVFSYVDWENKFSPNSLEKNLKENDVATYCKYLKLKIEYSDWQIEQLKHRLLYGRL